MALLVDAILNKSPELPSVLNPKISPGLEMAILKCLDKDPERRYQSAREVRVDLDRLTMPVSQVPTPAPTSTPALPSTPARFRRARMIVGVVLLVTAGAFSYLYFRGKTPEHGKPVNRRRTVAVLNLKNSTSRPEAAWLSTALPEMLTTELAAGEKMRTITGEQVAQMKL